MDYFDKLEKGENVYLYCDVGMNDIHEVVAIIIPDKDHTIIKQRNGTEFSVKTTSNIATDCRLFGKEITEQQYKDYGTKLGPDDFQD